MTDVLARSTVCATSCLQIVYLYDAARRPFTSSVCSSLAKATSWRQLPQSTSKSNTSIGSETAATEDVGATRLALLICSCYERAMTCRRACRSAPRGGSSTVAGSPDSDDSNDAANDAASRRRRELLGLFYALASSELSRPGLAGAPSRSPALACADLLEDDVGLETVLGRDEKAPPASAVSIHDLVVSASTPQGLELALSARKLNSSTQDLPAQPEEVPKAISEPSQLLWPLPGLECALPQTYELDEMTRDRDLFRTRAYQLAFKVDDLHNRHSHTLCALERAEATIEGLLSEKRDLVVALASLLSATSSYKTLGHRTSSLIVNSSISAVASASMSGSLFVPLQADESQPCISLPTEPTTDEVVLYPRTPTKTPDAQSVLEPTTEPAQLLLPAIDTAAASPLIQGGGVGDLDGSWRKRVVGWAKLSPTLRQGGRFGEEPSLSASVQGQAPSITMAKSFLGKLSWLRKGKGGRGISGSPELGKEGDEGVRAGDDDKELKLEFETANIPGLRPVSSAWLPAMTDAGLDCALEPETEEAVGDHGVGVGDGQATLAETSQVELVKDDTAVPPPEYDRPGAGVEVHSWMPQEGKGDLRSTNDDDGAFDSLGWRHNQSLAMGTLQRSHSSGSTKGAMSMRTQRSSISTSMNGNGFEPRSGRVRTSTGPPQTVSDFSSNWRDRNSDGVHRDGCDDHAYGGDGDGFGVASIKTRSGRRSFGFGAGGTRADEMCRLNAPYFQGSQGFQVQDRAQRQPLRRSQRCVFCKLFSLFPV